MEKIRMSRAQLGKNRFIPYYSLAGTALPIKARKPWPRHKYPASLERKLCWRHELAHKMRRKGHPGPMWWFFRQRKHLIYKEKYQRHLMGSR
jgi:hypothetical protein